MTSSSTPVRTAWTSADGSRRHTDTQNDQSRHRPEGAQRLTLHVPVQQLTCTNICSVTILQMTIPDHEVTAVMRSAAMAPPSSKVNVEREVLVELLEELMQSRSLLRR